MRKPESMLIGGKRFELLPPRSAPSLPRGSTVRLGPTAMLQAEALARLDGTTLNKAIANALSIVFRGAMANARDAMTSPYAADRTVAAENLAVLKGVKKNTARNLSDR